MYYVVCIKYILSGKYQQLLSNHVGTYNINIRKYLYGIFLYHLYFFAYVIIN